MGFLVGDGDGVGSSDPPVQAIAIPTIITVETTIHFLRIFIYLGLKDILELPILQTGPSDKKFPALAIWCMQSGTGAAFRTTHYS